jgi:hypothetical protein
MELKSKNFPKKFEFLSQNNNNSAEIFNNHEKE